MTNNSQNICSNCGENNPLFLTNCKKCKHYVREKVNNIDLWSTFWKLFENPNKALKTIIYAEHKNFLSFLIVFLGTKFFISAAFLQSLIGISSPDSVYPFYNFLILLACYSITLFVFTKLFTLATRRTNQTRFKDNLAIITYSFTPILFSLFFLTAVEYGIFGIHWFIFNPSPFIIKGNIAYTLAILEGIMFVWTIFILFKGFRLQSNSKLKSIIFTLLFYLIILAELIFIPYIII